MTERRTMTVDGNEAAASVDAARRRYAMYQQLAGISVPPSEVTLDDGASTATPEGKESR